MAAASALAAAARRGPLWSALTDRRAALAAVVLLGLAIRLAGLGDRLNLDEGYTWLVASAPDVGALFDRLSAYENTPPLYYLLAAPLPIGDEAWLRLPALLASVAAIPVLYAIVRPLLGTRIALLAALLLAVAPYHVAFANNARGFSLASLGLLLALWAVARLAQGGGRRWWSLYAVGGTVAVYSQYYAIFFLAPLVAVLLVLRARRWREIVVFGAVPVVAFLPWLPELARSVDAVNETKSSPIFPGPSAASLRDAVVPLIYGESGGNAGAGARTMLFLVAAAALALATVWLWRGTFRLAVIDACRRRASCWLFAGTGLAALAMHALVAALGPDLFHVRYLTILIPLAATLGAAAVVALPWRPLVPLVATLLVVVGLGVAAQREGREREPDLRRAEAVLRAEHVTTVLTNSPVVDFYFRDPQAILDRPLGFGEGLEGRLQAGGRRYGLVEDTSIGHRSGPGRRALVGQYEVRLVAH